ncbi:MAG: DUF6069 family protein [Caldilineaceae bacterium]
MNATINATLNKPPFTSYLLGGIAAGVVTAVLNNLWNLIYPAIGGVSAPEVVNLTSITLASILPLLIAAVGYFILARYAKNPTPVFQGVTIALALLTIAGSLNPPMPVPDGFVGLSAPMHVIAGLVGAFVIPRFVR